jgi:hypothetical protein
MRSAAASVSRITWGLGRAVAINRFSCRRIQGPVRDSLAL